MPNTTRLRATSDAILWAHMCAGLLVAGLALSETAVLIRHLAPAPAAFLGLCGAVAGGALATSYVRRHLAAVRRRPGWSPALHLALWTVAAVVFGVCAQRGFRMAGF